MLMKTQEENFNDRFRNEAAGSSALMGIDEDEHSDIEMPE